MFYSFTSKEYRENREESFISGHCASAPASLCFWATDFNGHLKMEIA
jgi:hypothetical protein